MQLYRPSVVAVSVIICARMVANIIPVWNNKIKELTSYGYSPNEVQPCFEMLYSIYNNSVKGAQNSNERTPFNKKALANAAAA